MFAAKIWIFGRQEYFLKESKEDVHFSHFSRRIGPTVINKCYWNDLPLSVRSISSKPLAKKALYKYYLLNIKLS